jgi:hypothetical protein
MYFLSSYIPRLIVYEQAPHSTTSQFQIPFHH